MVVRTHTQAWKGRRRVSSFRLPGFVARFGFVRGEGKKPPLITANKDYCNYNTEGKRGSRNWERGGKKKEVRMTAAIDLLLLDPKGDTGHRVSSL